MKIDFLEKIDKKHKRAPEKNSHFTKHYESYKEYFIKTFISHAPYESPEEISDFASQLTIDLESRIYKEHHTFVSPSIHNKIQIDNHVWNYLSSIAESLLDKSLITIFRQSHSEKIRSRAHQILEQKYKDSISLFCLQKISNSETRESRGLYGYDLEKYLESEASRISDFFLTQKFPKLIKKFHYKKTFAIFNKYMERSLKNFIQDYFRGKSVKHMRRVILYKEELPEDLFIYLMNIKGHGNLFYYKKKSNSLSIRDTKKAMAVIKELDFPSLITEEFEELLKLATKRAEYQRIIDNIRNYITEKCLDQSCKMGINPKIITILLYAGDHVMKKRLKIKEYQIEIAKEKLRNCVHCLGIDFNSVDNFYRI